MRIYLAGPMRGYLEYNFPEFIRVAQEIRDKGHDVFNPAERELQDGFNPETDTVKELAYYMQMDLPEVCKSDAVAVLKGWDKSRGAVLEVLVAFGIGKKLLDAYTLEETKIEVTFNTEKEMENE